MPLLDLEQHPRNVFSDLGDNEEEARLPFSGWDFRDRLGMKRMGKGSALVALGHKGSGRRGTRAAGERVEVIAAGEETYQRCS